MRPVIQKPSLPSLTDGPNPGVGGFTGSSADDHSLKPGRDDSPDLDVRRRMITQMTAATPTPRRSLTGVGIPDVPVCARDSASGVSRLPGTDGGAELVLGSRGLSGGGRVASTGRGARG